MVKKEESESWKVSCFFRLCIPGHHSQLKGTVSYQDENAISKRQIKKGLRDDDGGGGRRHQLVGGGDDVSVAEWYRCSFYFMNSQEARIAYLKWGHYLHLRLGEARSRRVVLCALRKKLSPGDISRDAQKCMERESQTGIAWEESPAQHMYALTISDDCYSVSDTNQ